MTTALQEVLARIEQLSESLTPEEQASAVERLTQLADQLEHEREWDTLLATPESQAYLAGREREVFKEFEAGETEEGGWE